MYMIEYYDVFFDIEQSLYKTRLISNTSLKDISSKEEGLHIVVMYRIEKHKNYHVSSLLKYASILKKKLYADDVLIDSLDTLGNLMKSKRQSAGLSVFRTSTVSGLIPKTILKIEHGKDYNKSTLAKYLSYFPVNFRIE